MVAIHFQIGKAMNIPEKYKDNPTAYYNEAVEDFKNAIVAFQVKHPAIDLDMDVNFRNVPDKVIQSDKKHFTPKQDAMLFYWTLITMPFCRLYLMGKKKQIQFIGQDAD